MTTLNFNQIEKLAMSEKARLLHDALSSLCTDFQKSDLHSDILETAYPFADSCDETAAQVWAWFEAIGEREKEVPVIQNKIELDILHSDTFKKAMHDDGATIFVKSFNNDRGAHKDYIFKWQNGEGQIFYNGVTVYNNKGYLSDEQVIKKWLSEGENSFDEDDMWCWIEEYEFLEWLQTSM
jgi:hypothetical protein